MSNMLLHGFDGGMLQLSWNVRGLNNAAKQEVKQMLSLYNLGIISLQKTKLSSISQTTVISLLGPNYANNFAFLPAAGTRGGILKAAKESVYSLSDVNMSQNTIMVNVMDCRTNFSCSLSGIYGPHGDLEKKMFIRELRNLKQATKPNWLLVGDFNLIYKAQDKNNGRINRRLMLRFRKDLNHMEVKELDFIGRKFTWSNNQSSPTLTRIDRAFCTPAFEDQYNNLLLQPMSSFISNHCPLLPMPLSTPRAQPNFRFESFWPRMHGFLDCVQQTWNKQIPQNQNPFGVLHIKLSRVANALRRWSKSLIPQGKLALAICREVIKQLKNA
jgi:exonuclease III